MPLNEEARYCRRVAAQLADKPDAPFLLHLAEAFEELAAKADQRPDHRRPPQGHRQPTA